MGGATTRSSTRGPRRIRARAAPTAIRAKCSMSGGRGDRPRRHRAVAADGGHVSAARPLGCELDSRRPAAAMARRAEDARCRGGAYVDGTRLEACERGELLFPGAERCERLGGMERERVTGLGQPTAATVSLDEPLSGWLLRGGVGARSLWAVRSQWPGRRRRTLPPRSISTRSRRRVESHRRDNGLSGTAIPLIVNYV